MKEFRFRSLSQKHMCSFNHNYLVHYQQNSIKLIQSRLQCLWPNAVSLEQNTPDRHCVGRYHGSKINSAYVHTAGNHFRKIIHLIATTFKNRFVCGLFIYVGMSGKYRCF